MILFTFEGGRNIQNHQNWVSRIAVWLALLGWPGLALLGWLGLALLGWLGLAGLAGWTCLAWVGLAGVAWERTGGGLGRFYYPGTIRELSGNYPGFKAGWAGWTWLGLAGLVGLGWLVGPGWAWLGWLGWAGWAGGDFIYLFRMWGDKQQNDSKTDYVILYKNKGFLMNSHDIMFFRARQKSLIHQQKPI